MPFPMEPVLAWYRAQVPTCRMLTFASLWLELPLGCLSVVPASFSCCYLQANKCVSIPSAVILMQQGDAGNSLDLYLFNNLVQVCF